jgi:hypothetical protein
VKKSVRRKETKWTDPDGGVWKQHVMSERAYCLHMRAGIFGYFASAWEDSAATPMCLLAPSDVHRVDNRPVGAIPDSIQTGCFCRLLYIRNETCGTFRVEPITGDVK